MLQNLLGNLRIFKVKTFVLKLGNSLLPVALLRQSTATSSNIAPSSSLKCNLTLHVIPRHISSADDTSLLNNHTFSYFGMSKRKLTPSFTKYNGEAAEQKSRYALSWSTNNRHMRERQGLLTDVMQRKDWLPIHTRDDSDLRTCKYYLTCCRVTHKITSASRPLDSRLVTPGFWIGAQHKFTKCGAVSEERRRQQMCRVFRAKSVRLLLPTKRTKTLGETLQMSVRGRSRLLAPRREIQRMIM